MKLKIVDYDIALKLNKLGFNWYCRTRYIIKSIDAIKKGTLLYSDDEISPNWEVFAPSQSLVLKWIRDIHQIHIEIYCNHSGWGWILTKTNGTTLKEIRDDIFFKSYELAEEEGIKRAFELINKK